MSATPNMETLGAYGKLKYPLQEEKSPVPKKAKLRTPPPAGKAEVPWYQRVYQSGNTKSGPTSSFGQIYSLYHRSIAKITILYK